MTKGIFITATGTDVGKTYVTAEIIRVLRKCGVKARYYKAALSGTEIVNGKRIAGDAHYVYQRAELQGDPNEAVTTILDYPASPHLSARMEGKSIFLEPILEHYNKMAAQHDFMVMEGSGGLVCPLNLDGDKLMLTDVIKALDLDILLVADAGLGTINSVILSIAYAKSLGIHVKGIILNRYDPLNLIHLDNLEVLEKMTEMPILTCKNKGILDEKILKMVTA